MKSRESSKCDVITADALTPDRLVHINRLRVSFAHAHAEVLKHTSKQHGVRLIRDLVSCSVWSRAKGQTACTPLRTTGNATRPMNLVDIDTDGPYPM